MARITQAELQAIANRNKKGGVGGVKRWQALGRLPKDQMNNTERAFANYLEHQKTIGNVVWYAFHPFNVRLAKDTFYEADFLALMRDMTLTIFEVKGSHVSEKGAMKIKLCAEVLPLFNMVKVTKLPKKGGGGFKFEEF